MIMYTYHPLSDFSLLLDFECEVPSMNQVIHAPNFRATVEYYQCDIYGVWDDNLRLVAFFALRNDELSIDATGSFRALEIAYLAVSKDVRRQGIGKACIREIIRIAKSASEPYAMLTVDALSITYPKRERYEAVSFYRKCHFSQTELQAPDKDTVRMVYVIVNEDNIP